MTFSGERARDCLCSLRGWNVLLYWSSTRDRISSSYARPVLKLFTFQAIAGNRLASAALKRLSYSAIARAWTSPHYALPLSPGCLAIGYKLKSSQCGDVINLFSQHMLDINQVKSLVILHSIIGGIDT